MGSTRLPGKVMKIIDTKNPSLQYTINQLQNCKTLDKIIVATTNFSEDAPQSGHFSGALSP